MRDGRMGIMARRRGLPALGREAGSGPWLRRIQPMVRVFAFDVAFDNGDDGRHTDHRHRPADPAAFSRSAIPFATRDHSVVVDLRLAGLHGPLSGLSSVGAYAFDGGCKGFLLPPRILLFRFAHCDILPRGADLLVNHSANDFAT